MDHTDPTTPPADPRDNGLQTALEITRELFPTAHDARPAATVLAHLLSSARRPWWRRQWVGWVGGGLAVVLVGGLVVAVACWPRQDSTPGTSGTPDTGATRRDEPAVRMELTLTPDPALPPSPEPVAVRGPTDFPVFALDRYTHATQARTARRHGWCYQIDARGAQLIYPLRPDGRGRLSGSFSGTFDAPPGVVYEYFVVILADADNPTLSTDTGTEVARWLPAEEVAALQAAGRAGPATAEAQRVLTAALERLFAGRPFEVHADAYLHHPTAR